MAFEVEDFFATDVEVLRADPVYERMFLRAFGTTDFTSKEVAFALAQFIRTLVSSNSAYDQFERGERTMTPEERRGYTIYYSERGDCFHCHGTILLTDNLLHNDTNLRYGCTILRFYYDKEKGDLRRALGRYNGSLGKRKYPNKVIDKLSKKWFQA